MKSLTLRQLKIFEAVARHASFSRAAEDLCLTQPAVSMQIKQLEELTGLPLFSHAGKKFALTEAGKVLLHHSHVIISQFLEVEKSIARLKTGADRALRIGVINTGGYFFPRLVNAFTQRVPGVEFDLKFRSRDELVRLLGNDEIDLAVMVQAPEDPAIVAEDFAPNPFVLVASPTHPLAGLAGVELARIADERLISRESGTDTRCAMDIALAGRFDPSRLMEIPSSEAIKQSVMAGMGISFLSAYTIWLEIQAGLLVVLDVDGFPIQRSLCVTHLSAKPLSTVALAFKQFLLTEGAAHINLLAMHDRRGREPEENLNLTQPALLISSSPSGAHGGCSAAPLRSERLPDQHGVQYKNHRGGSYSRPDHLLASPEIAHH
jgi:LysR family transcriptional regulator, low CO2-responsive transcriptional regulator